jgi:trimeric autotransporter adhesin
MKRLSFRVVFFIAMFFPLTIPAQNFGSVTNIHKTFPPKIILSQPEAIPGGTYTVGASGDFPTIDSAFNSLSMDGIAGPVTLELTDTMYTSPSDEYGFLLNGPIPGADEYNRVTIEPAVSMNVTVEGSGGGVFTFVNTSYLTMDGISLSGNQSFTVQSIRNTQYVHNQPISFFDNSNHNEVKNLNIMDGDNTYQAAPIGFFVNTSGSVPDSNLVENNIITGGSIGAVIVGMNSTVEPTGNRLTGNFIASETESLRPWGFFIQLCSNTFVENNIIQNLRINGEDVTYGIQVVSCDSTIIRNNVIHDVYNETGPTGSMGIILDGGHDNTVYNNMIYDIRTSPNGQYLTGILIYQETNPKIYYNSIYLSGGGAYASGSTDLYIQSGTDSLDLRDNILINTRVDSPKTATVINDYTSSNITSNYNDLYCSAGPDNYLVGILGTYYKTLEDWETTGQDSNSLFEMPVFRSPDLHIDTTVNTDPGIDSSGTPIAGIESDIDGDLRDPSTPDIGADEFVWHTPVEVLNNNFNVPLKFSLSQNYPNPFNPTTTIKYSLPKSGFTTLKVYDITGREVITLLNDYKEAGSYEIEFNAANLASGVYFYRLNTGNFSAVKKLLFLK